MAATRSKILIIAKTINQTSFILVICGFVPEQDKYSYHVGNLKKLAEVEVQPVKDSCVFDITFNII